ncbi:alpha/beta fold hydrolase [Actinokineospora inagensis]|uniref:alpha/beta fold hydrolase n=1 Tax=Actinokineospora inagensis TaxID=103730 RepID=UPI00047951F2|nr:alpha/beta hydrolase [Actinokineospora inagensis]
MAEETATGVGPDRITTVYERFGDPGDPPVLLVMGGGAQMINWPDGFCAELVERGLHVIRFDNRDSGRSTHFTDGPEPNVAAALAGDFSSVSYTLSDMAADTIGLLDALGLRSVHLVGASLGGMVAQTIALEHRDRVRSLTSMMSTTGNPDVGRANFAAIGPLGEPPADRDGYIAWQVRALRAVGSPGFRFDERAATERATRAYDRGGRDNTGMLRQAVASIASGDRTDRLRSLDIPALVIHGAADLMCDVSGGRATAAAITGAELLVVDGMGHGFPGELWPLFAQRIGDLVERADRSGPATSPPR